MTTTSHRDCTHPKTKAARARCRKTKADIAEMKVQLEAENLAYYEAYIRPHEEQEAAREAWEELYNSDEAHPGQCLSATINADDTSREEGFQPQSKRWYEVAYSTLAMLIDCGENSYPDTQFK